jgi:hypothetical protein
MKNFIKVLIIILSLSNYSYGQYHELEKCINDGYKKSLKIETLNFNLFDSIKVFEDYLIKSKLLKNPKQKSYRRLIKKNISKKDLEKIMNDVQTNNKFIYEFNDGTYTVLMYNTCPYRTASSDKKMSEIFYPIIKIYNEFGAEMYPTKRVLNKLSCKTNYNNKVSRLMLCNLIFINWIGKYKEEMLSHSVKPPQLGEVKNNKR